MSRSLFVSDVHLSEHRNNITTAFLYFLREIPREGDALYILGDLFDYWVGDDLETDLTREVANNLKKLNEKGVYVYFQHGNRDFSLGKTYADSAYLKVLPPYYQLPTHPDIMIMHGDELCVEDLAYQRYKRWIRNPFILSTLKKLPISIRLRIAKRIRQKSINNENKEIVDVTEKYVETVFRRYQLSTIIHGHTHKPGVHPYSFGTRYVLSDWDRIGDYLVLENNQIIRHTITIRTEKLV